MHVYIYIYIYTNLSEGWSFKVLCIHYIHSRAITLLFVFFLSVSQQSFTLCNNGWCARTLTPLGPRKVSWSHVASTSRFVDV